MARLSEVAGNAKRLKEQIAERAGVETNYVNDRNLAETQKMLQGAQQVAAAGQDPRAVDPAALKSVAAGEGDVSKKEKPEDLSNQKKLAMAITAFAPVLLGYAFGGNEGGAIGADVGGKALKDMGDREQKEEIAARELASKKELKAMDIAARTEAATEREKDRAEQRRFTNTIAAQREQDRQEDRKTKQEAAAEKAAHAASLDGRLAKLSKEKQDSVIKAKEAIQAVQGMAGAYKSGDNTFSLVGDNDYTRNRTWFEEALGRMQSGGAITKDEETRFRKMAPSVTDSKEQQMKKLVALESLMQDRLKILGFSPDDFGFQGGQVAQLFPDQKLDLKSFGFENPAMPKAVAETAPPPAPDFDNMSEDDLKKYLGKK